LDWIEQCFTSLPTQYRLYGRRFLQVKRPNRQYQSTEGTYNTQITEKHNNRTHTTKNAANPLDYTNGVTRGWLPQRAGSPCLNGSGTAAAVHPLCRSEYENVPMWSDWLFDIVVLSSLEVVTLLMVYMIMIMIMIMYVLCRRLLNSAERVFYSRSSTACQLSSLGQSVNIC